MNKNLIILFTTVLSGISHVNAGSSLSDMSSVIAIPDVSTYPVYPSKSKEDGEEGTVLIAFTVDQTGVVRNVFIRKSSGYPELDKSALSYAQKQTKFNPPIKDGVPVKSIFILPINFRLN